MNTTNDINIPHGIDGGITESNPVNLKVKISGIMFINNCTTVILTDGNKTANLVLIGIKELEELENYVSTRQNKLENWLNIVGK